MVKRKKYAKYWQDREPAQATARFEHKPSSKYMPHQGKREMARRRRKMGVTFGQYAAQEVFTYNT